MKAELIANIITAHCSGDEANFKAAVDELAKDEDRKGKCPCVKSNSLSI